MSLTTALTALLPLVITVSVVLAAFASALLLRAYRRAVIHGMSQGEPVTPDPAGAATAPPSSSLQLHYLDSLQAQRSLWSAARRSRRHLSTSYLLSALLYALVMSVPWLVTAQGGLPLGRLLWLLAVFSWPAAVLTMLVTADTARQRGAIAALYALAIGLAGGTALARNPELQAGELLYHWLFANLPGTVLAALVCLRRVRAVAPLVLAFMLLGVTGALVLVQAASRSETLQGLALSLAGGSGAMGAYVMLHAIGFIAMGGVGWWLLQRLGRAYRARRLSDQSIQLDAVMLLFAVLHCFTLSFEAPAWILTSVVAFGAYKLCSRLLLRQARTAVEPPVSMLLLRVFALGSRSEALFEQLRAWWLRIGSIDLIAGPDLATATVEPHEFLDFAGGRLARQFVEDQAALERRLAQREQGADPDGRHRVNEFFCRDHTWRLAVAALAGSNAVVVMDLRSFSSANAGCRWELGQLLAWVPLQRVLLLLDSTTDEAYLESVLGELWAELPEQSCNRNGDPGLRLMRIDAAAGARVAQAALAIAT